MLFIQEYIKQRIKEYTQVQNLSLHFRHLALQPNEKISIKAGTDIYLLTDLIDDVRVESDTGLFDFGSNETNEQVYEHRGELLIENLSSNFNHIPFIQFTEKNKTHGNTNSFREH
ncbi:MAG: hypothetical protein IPI46_09895 [Bacteroidetes bacterium]|nr:hypothetical protein [Bacteroidota bacterium]